MTPRPAIAAVPINRGTSPSPTLRRAATSPRVICCPRPLRRWRRGNRGHRPVQHRLRHHLGQTRSWTNGPGYAADGVNGVGWVDTQLPSLQEIDGTTTLALISNGVAAEYFDLVDGSYQARYFEQDTLVWNSSSNQYAVTDEAGDQISFYDFSGTWTAAQRGQLASFTDPDGNTAAATYNTAGQLTEVQRSSGSLVESWQYTYLGSGDPNAGLLSNVTLALDQFGLRPATSCSKSATPITTARKPTATSATWSSPTSTTAPIPATPSTPTTTAITPPPRSPPAPTATSTAWNTSSRPTPTPAWSAPMAAASMPSATRRSAPYADNYFQYDPATLRVIEEVAQGDGCSTCRGGLGTFTYAYTTNSSNPAGYNSWAMKTVEGLPDGNENIVYTNAYGEVMLSVYEDTTTDQQWDTFYQYDGQGRCTLMASPSAVTGFDDSYPDLLNCEGDSGYQYLSDNSGLITLYSYASTTTATATTPGDVAGYQQSTSIRARPGRHADPAGDMDRTTA